MLCDGVRGPLMLVIPVLHWAETLSFGAVRRGRIRAWRARRAVLHGAAGDRARAARRGRGRHQPGERALPGRDAGDDAARPGARRPADRASSALRRCCWSTRRPTSSPSLLVAIFLPRPRAARRGRGADAASCAGPPLPRARAAASCLDAASSRSATPPGRRSSSASRCSWSSRFDADPKIAGLLIASFGIGAVAGTSSPSAFLARRMDGMTTDRDLRDAMPGAAALAAVARVSRGGSSPAARRFAASRTGSVNPSLHTIMTLRIPPALRPTVMTRDDDGWSCSCSRSASSVAGPVLRRVRAPARCWSASPRCRRSHGAASRSCRCAARAPAAALDCVCSSSWFAFAVSAANPAWRKSFAAAAPSDQVSRRPKRGARICVEARPAAVQVPTQRVQVTSSPIAWLHPALDGLLVLARVRVPSTNGSRTKLVTSSRASVRAALNVAAAEHDEVERRLALRVAVEQRGRARRRPRAGREGAHDQRRRPRRAGVRRGARHGRTTLTRDAGVQDIRTPTSRPATSRQAIAQLAESISGGRALPDAARRDRHRQDGDDGLDHRADCQQPALVIAHNKTLAAQLCNEFREFFPTNAVEYFVSYYDYYQPEAYVPQADLYIEKDSSQNDDIARLRLAATSALFTRRDVVVVASVSCIYGLGSPEEWRERVLILEVGEEHDRDARAAEADRQPVRPQRHGPRRAAASASRATSSRSSRRTRRRRTGSRSSATRSSRSRTSTR